MFAFGIINEKRSVVFLMARDSGGQPGGQPASAFARQPASRRRRLARGTGHRSGHRLLGLRAVPSLEPRGELFGEHLLVVRPRVRLDLPDYGLRWLTAVKL
jgi:hypothetical protein